MQALNQRQQNFVMIMWECAPISAAEAVRRAGYKQSQDSSGVQAYALMHNPGVRAAMIEYGHGRMSENAPALYQKLFKIAASEQHKDQAKVAMALFSRAGFREVIEQTHNININVTRQEKIASLRETMIAEGKSPAEIEAVFGSLTDYEVEGTSRDITGTAEDPFADEDY